MSRRAKMTQLPSSGCRASMGILLVALLGAFLVFTTGAAEACSKHVTSGNFVHSAKIAQEGRHLAQVAAVVTTLKICCDRSRGFKPGSYGRGGGLCRFSTSPIFRLSGRPLPSADGAWRLITLD